MCVADATTADVEAVGKKEEEEKKKKKKEEEEEEEEEEEKGDGSGGLGGPSELFDGVGGEGEVGGATTHGVDAEDSRLLQYVSLGDPVLSVHLLCQSKIAEVEVIESPRLILVDRPGLPFKRQRRQNDCIVHLQLDVGVETMTVPDCIFQTAKGLAGFRNPAGNFFVNFVAAGECAAQIREAVHYLQLGSAHADLRRIVGGCVGRRLVHDHRHLRSDDQVEVLAGGREEISAPLHVSFSSCIEDAIVGDEKFMNGSCGYTRLEVHPPLTKRVAVGPVGDTDR
nr:unnamed protein product [Spirometra erinaceieuropaei]